jgi:hypothetical protein
MLTTDRGASTIFSKNTFLYFISQAERFQVDYIFEYRANDTRCDIFTFNRFASWEEVRSGVIGHFRNDFLGGNGWHFALAVARRDNAPLLAFMDDKGRAVHIVADLKNGDVADIRGSLRLDQALVPFEHGRRKIAVTPVEVASVVSRLDLMADMSCEHRENWNDPETCEFASLSNQLLDISRDI